MFPSEIQPMRILCTHRDFHFITRVCLKTFILFGFLISSMVYSQEEYLHGPDSEKYEGIPHGTVTKHTWESTIYANTIRDYYVYVPAQHRPSEPAALMVFQDGHTYVKEDGDFRVPTVFDNLMAQQKMPVTIGLFINPGHHKDMPTPENPWKSSNRSMEYDAVSDVYGRFLLEEMIPELKKNYAISDDPRKRSIGGISSGGICAFSAAWFFPQHFNKVLSHIGSFTDIRGGHAYPSMIRKQDKKNIKVFLQDGSHDLDNQYGNWWLANLQMESALKFKEYDYKFIKGNGAHNGNHGGAILPQSLKWLWNDVVPEIADSGVYSFPKKDENKVMMAGETFYFSDMELKTVHLTKASADENLRDPKNEQIVIVKEGELQVSVNNKKRTIGPNSVVVLLPGDNGSISCASENAAYYTMVYRSKRPMDLRRGKKNGGSFIVDFDELKFKEHDKGGIRNYFHRATAMCPYYEMHVTNLNPGIKSHEPHTHKASEIILMIKGNTEMEIGNEKFTAQEGDFYFASGNIPHAIKNVGDEQCMYFAFQWE